MGHFLIILHPSENSDFYYFFLFQNHFAPFLLRVPSKTHLKKASMIVVYYNIIYMRNMDKTFHAKIKQ